jgi:glucose-1-phosphate cytidylyltransferase
VQPPGRFGVLNIDERHVTSFEEKPHGDGGWINGGFFVLSPKVIDYIDDEATVWERAPMETLAKQKQLAAFPHRGFWHAMDTLRDKNQLEEMWQSGSAPWKVWS